MKQPHDQLPGPARPPGDVRAGAHVNGSRLLTAEEAAELLAVPVSFVRQETRAERMPYVALGARYRRYSADDLEAWWRSRRRGPRTGRDPVSAGGGTR